MRAHLATTRADLQAVLFGIVELEELLPAGTGKGTDMSSDKRK